MKIIKNKAVLAVSVLLCSAMFCSCSFDVSDLSSLINETESAESVAKISQGTMSDAYVSYIDIGQGDSELIETDGYNILIDGGEKGEGDEVIAYLKERGITKLDYVIASHPHSDHIGGLTDVMYSVIKGENDLEIDTIITGDLADSIVPTTKVYTYFLEDADELGVNFEVLEEKEVLTLGESTLILIPSPFNDDENLNNESVAAIFEHGDNTFVFTGDAEEEEESSLVDEGAFDGVDADVFKAGHHGSRTASSEKLLSAITPDCVVISCGTGNSYGHPHEEALERFSEFTDEILRTDLQGTIMFTSDGSNLSYSTEK